MAILTSSMWDPYKFKELEMVHKSSVVSTQCFLFTQKHPVPMVPSTMPEHSHTPHAQSCFSTPSSSHVHPNTENRFAPVAMALSAGGRGEGCFNATQQYLPWFCYRDAQGFLEKMSGLPESSTQPSQLKAAPVLGSSTPAFAEEQTRLYRKMTRSIAALTPSGRLCSSGALRCARAAMPHGIDRGQPPTQSWLPTAPSRSSRAQPGGEMAGGCCHPPSLPEGLPRARHAHYDTVYPLLKASAFPVTQLLW